MPVSRSSDERPPASLTDSTVTELGEASAWARVEALFHTALDLPAKERRAYLEDACGGDETLRAEVTSLLAAAEGPDLFNDDAAGALALELAAGSRSAEPGDVETVGGRFEAVAGPKQIGPYRILDVLGHGGMGTVYLAEQCDALKRQVALKLIRWSGEHHEMLRRFEIEREAMARLNHPAVAQVFDAGTTEQGQPYIVIEHIPGEPITTYCDSRRLSLRARLALFVIVCDGVLHAHAKGVIHRDLKPSNILVAETRSGPRPKIIDFGIAKALEPWSEAAAKATATRLRIGSPGYMSPEAASDGGRAVDVRSDVYSLGVVLYELLAGVGPFESPPISSSGAGSGEAVESPRPSRRFRGLPIEERRRIASERRVDHRRLVRRLRGELDWIARRATNAKPSARYGTVASLAADVESWMKGLPVSAKPPSVAYRARKTIRRHAVAFATGVLIFATIIGFSIRSNILYSRAETARVQAEELVTFMLDDLSAQLEPRGRLDLLESISRRSLDYFESSTGRDLASAGSRPSLALRQTGVVLATRGDLDAATEAFERARGIDQRRMNQDSGDPSPRLDLVADLELLSAVRSDRGDVRVAGDLLREAEELLRALNRDLPGHVLARRALAAFLVGEGANFERLQNRSETAQAMLEEGQAILQDLLRAAPDDLEVRRQIGEAHYLAGLLAMGSWNDPVAAIRAYEAGIEVFRDLSEMQPDSVTWRLRLAVLQGQGLATAYRYLDRLVEAQEASSAALALFDRLVLEEPGNNRWAHSLCWELLRQGELAALLGLPEEAIAAYRRAAQSQSALVARTTGNHTDWLDALAIAHGELAAALIDIEQYQEAWTAAENALVTRRRISAEEEASPYYQISLAAAGLAVVDLRDRHGDGESARDLLADMGAILDQVARGEIKNAYDRSLLDSATTRFADLTARTMAAP